MSENHSSKSSWLGKLVRTVAVLSLVVAIVALLAPTLRKSGAVSQTGKRAVTELSALSTAVSYYAGDEIAALAQEPKADAAYKSLAGLFAQISAQQSYEDIYLLARKADKQYQIVVDGAYRDNAVAGTDYYALASAYPTDVYKTAKGILDKIYTGKTGAVYANDLVIRKDLKKVVTAYLPIYGAGRTVLAVICAECDPGNTVYHMVGPVNLNYLGGAAALLFALCLLLLYLGKKFASRRKAEPTPPQEQAEPQDEQDVLPPSATDVPDSPGNPGDCGKMEN